MKHCYKAILAGLSALMVGGFTSCVDPNKTPDPAQVPSVSVIKATEGDAQFKSSSAVFSISSNMIEKCAWKIEEGKSTTKPEPVIIFADAKETVDIKDAKQNLTIYGLEGGKTYTIHLAFKIKDKTEYLMESIEVTTPDYDRMITLIDAGYDYVKIHIKVPDQNKFYRWVIWERATYERAKDQFNLHDLDYVSTGLISQGDTTVTVKNGDVFMDYGDGDPILYYIVPGMSMVTLLAECDQDGNIAWDYAEGGGGGGGWGAPGANRPDAEEYIEEYNDPNYLFEGFFARQFFYTRPPVMMEEKFEVKSLVTERTARFQINPPKSILNYGVLIMKASDYDVMMLKYAGEKGVMEFVLRDMQATVGPTDYKFMRPLEKDSLYKLFIIGLSDITMQRQIHHVQDFTSITSDQPAADVTVTQVEAPDKNPFNVCYNVKSSGGSKVSYIKYLMNSAADWKSVLNDVTTYDVMLDQYGIIIDDQVVIDQINSANGYMFKFNVWENTDYRIAIQTFSEDEKVKTFTCDGKSLKEQPKERVESGYFTSLLGDWTMTVTFKVWQLTGEAMTSRVKATISAGPDAADPTFFNPGNEQYKAMYDYYVNLGERIGKEDPQAYATEQIKMRYDEFSDLSTLYAEKYRGQNRLLMTGLQVNSYDAFINGGAWNLFCDLNYTSFTTEEIFYDFGPKLFIEVGKDGKLFIPTDYTIAPFQNHNTTPTFVTGSLAADDQVAFDGNFEVTVVDNDNITISHKTKDPESSNEYLMSFYSTQWGNTSRNTVVVEDIKLKRGFTPIEQKVASVPFAKSAPVDKPVVFKLTDFRKSNIPSIKYKAVEGKVWSYEESMKNSAAFQYLKKKFNK